MAFTATARSEAAEVRATAGIETDEAWPGDGSVRSAASPRASHVLGTLAGVAAERGPLGLAERLLALGQLTRDDLSDCEALLRRLPRGPSLVERSAAHLIDLAGKRLRPMCVALASRAGAGGFNEAAREFAVAVELVHSATLLHDDVVDHGDLRRGAPAARTLYGNAASIFAGDWLLVEALRRVRRARLPGALDRLLDVIDEMIFAESEQLAARGRLRADRAVYFRVIEGKTAALFRWAMWAGGLAGGLGPAECAALEAYGLHLGVAFQAVDDLLDLAGSEGALGKGLFADLREGKVTYPIIVALEREPALRGALEELIGAGGEPGCPTAPALHEYVLGAVRRTGGVEECRALAEGRAREAVACLGVLPPSVARAALETVAEAVVRRDR